MNDISSRENQRAKYEQYLWMNTLGSLAPGNVRTTLDKLVAVRPEGIPWLYFNNAVEHFLRNLNEPLTPDDVLAVEQFLEKPENVPWRQDLRNSLSWAKYLLAIPGAMDDCKENLVCLDSYGNALIDYCHRQDFECADRLDIASMKQLLAKMKELESTGQSPSRVTTCRGRLEALVEEFSLRKQREAEPSRE